MFGIGAGELLVIFIIAVVVIGPNKLPEVARTIGKVVAMAKRTSNQLREQMQAEVQKFQDMAEIKEFRQTVETEFSSIHEAAETYVRKEIAEEEQRLEQETQGINQVLTAETERMFASGVPEEDSAAPAAASPGSGVASDHPASEGNGGPSSPEASLAAGVAPPAHDSGPNGSVPRTADTATTQAEASAKPVS